MFLIRELLSVLDPESLIHLAKCRYFQSKREVKPDTTLAVPVWRFLSTNFLTKQIEELLPYQEFALQSLIIFPGGKKVHIPMMSFNPDAHLSMSDLWEIRSLSSTRLQFHIYDAGDSIQSYGGHFMCEKTWAKFMEELAYLSQPNQKFAKKLNKEWISLCHVLGCGSFRWTYITDKETRPPAYQTTLSTL